MNVSHVIAAIVFTSMTMGVYAQQSKTSSLESELHAKLKVITSEVQSQFDLKIGQLKKYGNDETGKYSLCSDVIKLHADEKNEIAVRYNQVVTQPVVQELSGTELNVSGSFSIQTDEKKVADRNAPFGKEVLVANVEPQSFKNSTDSGGPVCFVGSAPVTAYFKKRNNKHTFSLSGSSDLFAATTMEVLTSVDLKFNEKPRVLSSTYARFNQEPRYVKDCWAEVGHFSTGEVTHGSQMQTIQLKDQNGTRRTLEVTPEHRFLAYIKDASGSVMLDWVKAQNLNTQSMELYRCNEGKCNIESVSSYQVQDMDWWGHIEGDKKVYNLSTDTFAYYVGHKPNLVLVHNSYY